MPLASHMNCRSIALVVLINTRTFDALRSLSKRRDFTLCVTGSALTKRSLPPRE